MAGGMRSEQTPKLLRSLFDLPADFFDSARLLSNPREIPIIASPAPEVPGVSSGNDESEGQAVGEGRGQKPISRWTCNTCKVEFESLQDQRSHFKSDLHRLNVKLNMAGKETNKEEEVDDQDCQSLFEDGDISSISGSEDDSESELQSKSGMTTREREATKQKIHVNLQSGDTASLWSCLLLDEGEFISFEKKSNPKEIEGNTPGLTEDELIIRLKYLIQEPRDKTHLRIVLLVRGGHFAGCVFDGNTIIAHKTFHRYVVRAKAGKRQSAKDATGKAAHSAGSSLRRYNETALKKEIQELLVSWKTYLSAASCILVHAPSKNFQLLFDGENPILAQQKCAIRNIPLTVRRPTLKEAKRVYNHLTYITYVSSEEGSQPEQGLIISAEVNKNGNQELKNESFVQTVEVRESVEVCSESRHGDISTAEKGEEDLESDVPPKGTPLHEAAKSGDAQRILELLEQGLDPSLKDSRGQTPYMLAKEKEVRNTFRRFMASYPDKWDWNAANVPSPLTKELEESQAAKQAEKDAKRKTKAKELKKLRKAKEKAQAQAAAMSEKSAVATPSRTVGSVGVSIFKGHARPNTGPVLSKEEERKRALDIERERRAAAAERRIASLKALGATQTAQPSGPEPSSSTSSGSSSDTICSCCNASLAGKVPFHRYNYKYCSTSCMHVHREMLEDG